MAKPETWSSEKIEAMLNPMRKVELRVSKELSGLMKPFTVLLLVQPEEYSNIKKGIIMFSRKSHDIIIYISLNMGYGKFSEEIHKEKENMEGIHFIDLVSENSNIKKPDMKNVYYLSSPTDLSECIVVAEKILSDNNKKSLLILDSVSTLMVYNKQETTEKFIHALIEKANTTNSNAIIMSPDSEKKERVTQTIAQFVDRTIRI